MSSCLGKTVRFNITMDEVPVVWLQGRYAGLAFEESLKAEQVLRHVPAPRPKVKTEFRRPGLACRPLSDRERQMVERWMSDSTHAPGD